MVGLVIVSHSRRLAEGAAELARQMAGEDVAVEIAGGLDEPGHPIGTDAMLVRAAIDRAWSDDGVLVLMDLGSAVLSAEMALDFVEPERLDRIRLTHAPLVEGAVAAAVTARSGAPLDRVAAEAEGGLAGKTAHLGGPVADGAAEGPPDVAATEPAATLQLVVDLPHGLHARPAARLVQEAARFDADVRVRNRTTGAGPVSARSLNAVATLGVTAGQTLEVSAAGPQADEAVAAIAALGRRRFDEAAEDLVVTAPPPAPAAASTAPAGEGILVGIAAAAGAAVGPARRFRVPALPVPSRTAADADAERGRLEAALRTVRDDVRRQRDDARARIGGPRAAIFDAHLLFLEDPAILEPVREAIDRGATAAAAWSDAVASLARTWEALDDAYLRERADDLRSVGRQALARLLGVEVPRPTLDAPGVLVARDLEPADAAALDPATCLAIATERGGPTAHAAVVARGLGVPAVVALGGGLAAVAEGATVAV
ncbi:MAG TPA: dihydroxyacetone kinase phosphoryl donor subunit DhaM, partial [Actinomycetota bacterium]